MTPTAERRATLRGRLEEQPVRRIPPRLRWVKRTIIFSFLIVTVPLCALFVLVHTQWGRERIRDAAVEALRTELGLRADLDEVEVAIVPSPRIAARHIVLDDPVYGRFAEAEGLTIYPSLFALIQGKVDLTRIELDSPVVNLVIRDGEIRNLPRIRGATATSGDELPFSRLVATNASVTVDADPYGTAAMEGVDLTLDVIGGRELDISVSATEGRVDHLRGTERLQRFDATAFIDPDEGIELERFVLWTPHVKVTARDAHIPLPFDDSYYGHGSVRVNLAHLEELPHGWELPPMSGVFEVEADVEGTPDGPLAHGTLRLEQGVIDDRGLGDIELSVDLDQEHIRILDGQMRIIEGGGVARVTGTIGLGEGFPTQVAVDIEDLRFARLMEMLDVSPNAIVQWHIDGHAEMEGTLDPLELEGPIRLSSGHFLVTRDAWHATPSRRVVGVTRSRINGRVRLVPDALRFERLVANTPRSRLFGDVHLGFDDQLRVSVTSEIDIADASPLLDFPLGGTGHVSMEVDGTFSDPRVRGRVGLDSFAFNTFVLGDIETSYQMEEEGLAVRFPHIDAVKRESRYAMENLFLDFRDHRFAMDGRVDAQRFTLADFYHMFHYEEDERFTDYEGLVSGDADVRYTLGYPGDSPTGTMIAQMNLAIAEASINDFAFTDGEFRGRWRWLHYERGAEGGELEIQHLHMHKGESVVTLDGRMGLGGTLQITAAADRVGVRDTEGLTDRLPDLGGVYSVFADVRGTLDVPRADVDVHMTGLSWRGAMLGDARTYVRLTDREDPWIRAAEAWDPGNLPQGEPCAAARSGFHRGRWPADPPLRTIEGPKPRLLRPMAFLICGEGLGGQARVDLAVGRTQVYPLRGAVQLADLVLDPFMRQAQSNEPLTGNVSGRVELTGGAMLADNSLVGRAVVSQLRVGQPNVELRNEGDLDLRFDRGTFEVARAILGGPGSRITITGGGTARRGLAMAVDGEIDLGLVAQLSPRFTHAGGQVDVHVAVSGPMDAPAIYGQADVRDGSFRYAGFSQPLTDLRGQITFSARRVLFEDFNARMAGGRIALSGAATLRGQGIDRYEFEVEGRDLALSPEPGVDVAVGGRARLAWASEQRLPLLTGTVRLGRVHYTRPIALLQGLSLNQLSRRQRVDIEQYDPAEDRVELDLRIVDDTPIRLANNLIDAQIQIEDTERPFRVVGTDQRFGVTGTLEIPRGVVHFRNADFDIRRGRIDFDDPYRVDPNFDVVAETEIRRAGDLTSPSWRIQLRANGNGDAFRLNASSEPELSQEDIALLLTVGMTRAEADQLQAGDVGGTIALEALAAVTGIDREVQRALPVIDDFQITSRYSTVTGRTEPQVSIGKRITDRVRLTASSGLSESQEVQTTLEWRLDDQTSIQAAYDSINTSTASSVGNIGVDVRWRLEFE